MSTQLHSNTAHAPSGDGGQGTPDAGRVCAACACPFGRGVALYDVRFTDGEVRYGVLYCLDCVEQPATAMPTVDVLLLRESVPVVRRREPVSFAAFAREIASLPGFTPATAQDQRACQRADREARNA